MDDHDLDIRKTGILFERIFEIAKSHIDIKNFSSELKKDEFRSGLFNSILNSIDNSLIKEAVDTYGRLKKYKLT